MIKALQAFTPALILFGIYRQEKVRDAIDTFYFFA
jgi:hypothetical protein